MNILALIRKKKPETSSEIDKALTDVGDAERVERDELIVLEAQRDAMVLDASDKEIDAADQAIVAAERRLRDLTIARSQLAQRLEAAQKSEKRAEMEALAERARVAVARQREIYRLAAPMFEKLADLAAECRELGQFRQMISQRLNEAGFPELKTKPVLTEIEPKPNSWAGTTPLGFSHVEDPFEGLKLPHYYPNRNTTAPFRISEIARLLKG